MSKKEIKKNLFTINIEVYYLKCIRASHNSDFNSYVKNYENFKKKAQKYLNDIKEGKTTLEKFEKWLDKQT